MCSSDLLTSDFFNVFLSTKLKNFSEGDANDLVRLPMGNPALNEERQKLALKWGEGKPCLLQIAGLYLWEARSQDHDVKWAKAKFDQEAKHIQRDRNLMKTAMCYVSRVGSLGQQIGDTIDDLGNFAKGAFILFILGALITGAANRETIENWVRGTQQDVKGNFK